jgi:zinc resistance-associated protein
MTTSLRRSWLLLMLTAMLSLGMATAGWAGPRGMGGGCCDMGDMGMGPGMGMGHHGWGKGMMQLTPDQAAKAFDMRQKFMNDTADLRKQMLVKRAELRELWNAKEPDKAKIAAKQKEINAVRDQLQEKATAFKLDMRKEFPNVAGGAGCPMMGGGKGPGGAPAPEGAKK